jgi:hypothetical protein
MLLVAAGIAISLVLPLSMLLAGRAIFGKPRALASALSLALLVSSCSWLTFFALLIQPYQWILATPHPIIEALGSVRYALVLQLLYAPLSTLCGIGMLYLYLSGRIARSLKIVSLFFIADWALEVLYIYFLLR